jgi:drug/metabolite transporter (DMT)-like permease
VHRIDRVVQPVDRSPRVHQPVASQYRATDELCLAPLSHIHMAALLALTAAAAYGAGDFLGGVAARRIPATAVVLWSHVIGLLVLLVAAPLMGGEATARALGLGAVAGVVGAIGVTLFYRGLSLGAMSVVAPVTALLSAAVPVMVGVGSGERPQPTALVGIGLALVAITLVSRDDAGPGARSGLRNRALLLALAGGLGFGLFFVVIDAAGPGTGIWSLVGARATSVTLFGSLGAAGLMAAAPPRRDVAAAAIGAGLLDAAANVFYVLALTQGLLTVVAVLTTLYPVGTVLLARCFLGERMTRGQQAGLTFAGVAAILIAA